MIQPVIFKKAQADGPKKHSCADCDFCQMCSDSRCNACRGAGKKSNMSQEEQIRLFEKINKDETARPDRPLSIFDFPTKK